MLTSVLSVEAALLLALARRGERCSRQRRMTATLARRVVEASGMWWNGLFGSFSAATTRRKNAESMVCGEVRPRAASAGAVSAAQEWASAARSGHHNTRRCGLASQPPRGIHCASDFIIPLFRPIMPRHRRRKPKPAPAAAAAALSAEAAAPGAAARSRGGAGGGPGAPATSGRAKGPRKAGGGVAGSSATAPALPAPVRHGVRAISPADIEAGAATFLPPTVAARGRVAARASSGSARGSKCRADPVAYAEGVVAQDRSRGRRLHVHAHLRRLDSDAHYSSRPPAWAPVPDHLVAGYDACLDAGLRQVRQMVEALGAEEGVDSIARDAEARLTWAKEQRLLKVASATTPCPELGGRGVSARLHDIKVNPRGGGRGRTDDDIYAEHGDIRERVPRGLCLLELSTRSVAGSAAEAEAEAVAAAGGAAETDRKKVKLVVPVIAGLKKFVGGFGDEDSTIDRGPAKGPAGADRAWEEFFAVSPEECPTLVSTGKANGEAGHIAVRYVASIDRYLLFAGSKNVHCVFTCEDDLAAADYRDSRFGVCRLVAGAFLRELQRMDREQKEAFLSFLASTWMTLIVEVLDPNHQHVELFEFTEPRLCVISFVATALSDVADATGLNKCLNPLLSAKLAESFGLSTVTYQLHRAAEAEEVSCGVRNGYGTEGLVLVFVDADGAVAGLVKRKTAWYVAARALREKAKRLANRLDRIEKNRAARRQELEELDLQLRGNKGKGKGARRHSTLAAMQLRLQGEVEGDVELSKSELEDSLRLSPDACEN